MKEKKEFIEETTEEWRSQPKTKNKKTKIEKERKRSFLGNIKIAPKILLGFIIIALLSAGMGAYACANIVQVGDTATYMYEDVLLPVSTVLTLSDTFSEGCIDIRQAVMADSDNASAYITTLKSNILKYTSTMTMLETLVSGDAAANLETLEAAYTQYEEAFQDAIDKIEQGQQQEVFDDLMNSGDLKNAEDIVSQGISDLKYSITENASSEATQSKSKANMALMITMTAVGGVLILSVLIGIFMAKGFNRPIKKLTNSVKRLALGDTNMTMSVYPRKDEIGQMRDAISTILEAIKELENDTGKLIDAASEGQLGVRADVEKHQGIYRKIIEGINATLDSTVKPIKESTDVLSELANGNLDAKVTGDFKGDYALIKDALNLTIETLKRYIDEVAQILDNVAQGDMTVNITSDYKGSFVRLKNSINQSIVAFNDVLTEIDTASTQVASGSRQVSDGSQTISQGATEQASEIDQLTTTMTQIASQTSQNAQNADHANELVKTAKQNATAGNSQMEEMQQAMEKIKIASENISKIIKVIDDIAFQTNILALNAAVEAARAGAHGKGFAVVAEEVRNLAARSANAAKETTELIENSIAIVGSGTSIADRTADALSDIVSGVEKAAELVGQIAIASNEQVEGITQINNSIDQMLSVVQTNSATSQQTAATSQELSSQAEMLRDMVARFKLTKKEEAFFEQPNTIHSIGEGAANKQTIISDDGDFGKY